jgi:hypothetical protein
MNGFEPKTLTEDIVTFKTIFQDFARMIPADAWAKRTGTREKDWTLHDTIAHLVSIAVGFNRVADAAINQHKFLMPGLVNRSDLQAWNEAEIASRQRRPHFALVAELTSELDRTITYLDAITPEQMEQTAFLRVYNRPARAIDFLAWQLSHAGIIHAAQVTRPLNIEPLWSHYPTEMRWRQVDRFIQHFSVAYWQEYGPQAAETINVRIGDAAWHLIAAPDGGSAGQGTKDNAKYTLTFAAPEILFGVFTFHLPIRDVLQNGQMSIGGDFRETMSLMRLFSASPPGEGLA